jgi:hypothetical protein
MQNERVVDEICVGPRHSTAVLHEAAELAAHLSAGHSLSLPQRHFNDERQQSSLTLSAIPKIVPCITISLLDIRDRRGSKGLHSVSVAFPQPVYTCLTDWRARDLARPFRLYAFVPQATFLPHSVLQPLFFTIYPNLRLDLPHRNHPIRSLLSGLHPPGLPLMHVRELAKLRLALIPLHLLKWRGRSLTSSPPTVMPGEFSF